MRLLVVEDEHRVALSIATALAEEGFAVDVAHDGKHALTFVEANAYDVIILPADSVAAMTGERGCGAG
jgi:DNA-binding response OmpR family regulator